MENKKKGSSLIKNNYEVRKIDNSETWPFLLKKHYLKRIPSISFSFGLYKVNTKFKAIEGVVTFGIPVSKELRLNICGEKFEKKVYELNRLCLLHNEKNLASYLVSNAIKQLPKPTIIISFADTELHCGYIYQATNFNYIGKTKAHLRWRNVDGKHSRSIKKGQFGEIIKNNKDWWQEREKPKHRYIYFHTSKTLKKHLIKNLQHPIENYPKIDNKNYDSGGDCERQGVLF